VLAIKCFEELVFALNLLLDGFGECGLNQNQVLLQLDALGDYVALHGLFLEAAKLLEPLGDSLLFLFLYESLTSLSNGIHELRLE
jgi:hypothetical protein